MGEQEAFEAQRQAVREVASRPERQAHYEDAIRIYLAGISYAESRPRPGQQWSGTSTAVDEPAQPVDEPAPLAEPVTTRR